MTQFNPRLKDFVPYHSDDDPNALRMHLKESPYDIPGPIKTEALNIVRELDLNRYPDAGAEALRQELAAYTGVEPEQTIAGNGSDELLSYLVVAFGHKGVLTIEPTFAMYRVISQTHGAPFAGVPLDDDFDLDLEGFSHAIEHTAPSLIILCSPNNPTGVQLSTDRIEHLLADFNGLVVVDEAYWEFAGESLIDLLPTHENLILTRTLSKAFGLAALRTGYAIGDLLIIRELAKIKLPYNLNAVSQAIALAALRRRNEVLESVERILKERNRLTEALHGLKGVEPMPSATNFIPVTVNVSPTTLVAKLAKQGVLVRNLDGAIPESIQVTVGTPEQNDHFLTTLRTALKEVRSCAGKRP